MCGPERLVFPHWRKSCGLWNCYQYYDKIIFFAESMKPVIGDFIPWCGQLWIHTLVAFLASNPWVYSKSRINVQRGTWSTEALSVCPRRVSAQLGSCVVSEPEAGRSVLHLDADRVLHGPLGGTSLRRGKWQCVVTFEPDFGTEGVD